MAQIINYNTPVEFMKANREFIYNSPLSHYHLIHIIEQLKAQKIGLYDCFNLNDEEGHWVLGLRVDHGYYLYSKTWTPAILTLLVNRIELVKFKNISVCGQRDLVKQLFLQSKVEGEVFKNRFIEECIKINPIQKNVEGNGQNGTYEDYEELLQMCLDYYQEEFRGEGSQSNEDIAAGLGISIDDGNIYCWKDSQKQIVSMARIINNDNDDDFAMIGGFYTKPECRGKGYGFALMHAITKGLLEAGYKSCGLVSDADYEVTSKIFSAVGYKQIYNWVLINKYADPKP